MLWLMVNVAGDLLSKGGAIMREDIRDRLIAVARTGQVIFYGELRIGRGKAAGQILGDICQHEHSQSRPLLSAVVVNKGTGMPSEGFWGLSGIPPNLTNRQRPVFWARELIKVINYWQEHS